MNILGKLKLGFDTSSPEECTPAYPIFEINAEKIVHLDRLTALAAQKISDSAHRIKETVDTMSQIAPGESRSADIALHLDAVGEQTKSILTLYEWLPVVLVTVAEAYLTDVLVFSACADPKVMEKSEQLASYKQVLSASSLEELTDDMRQRWAQNFINDGGPRRWIDRLTKMGATGYRAELPDCLEFLWGVRHLAVHSAGIVTSDFVRRHPTSGNKVGEKMTVGFTQMGHWVEAVYHFVVVTDAFYVNRYKIVAPQAD